VEAAADVIGAAVLDVVAAAFGANEETAEPQGGPPSFAALGFSYGFAARSACALHDVDGVPEIVRYDAQALVATGDQFIRLIDDFASPDGAVARAADPAASAPHYFALVGRIVENSGATTD